MDQSNSGATACWHCQPTSLVDYLMLSLRCSGNQLTFQTHQRLRTYNNMCYLIEKYAPMDGIDEYDPSLDPMVTGAFITAHGEEKQDTGGPLA